MRSPTIGFRDYSTDKTHKRLQYKAKRTNTPYFALKRTNRSNPATGMNYEEFATYHIAELTQWLGKDRL